MRRMDRYGDENTKVSRSSKNQELYQDVANNPKYTNITDVRNVNAYEINSTEDANTREKYQQVKKYQELPKVKRELDDFNHLYPKTEKKIYDINTVLEDARKNRKDDDELEEKRKLKYTSYNILAGINLEELMKYREEKKKRQATPEEEEIHELMDTIASKTLAGELDKETTVDLLSDLMATNMLDKVSPSEEIVEKVEVPEELQKELTQEKPLLGDMMKELEAKREQGIGEPSSNVDKDFYTKSMDLSEEDFEMSDDFAEKKLPIGVKVLLIIIVLAVLAVAGYFIYQKLI
jgi:hypothetical protein